MRSRRIRWFLFALPGLIPAVFSLGGMGSAEAGPLTQFWHADKDRDGFLSYRELQAFDPALSNGFEVADLNSDGRLDIIEFKLLPKP